MILIILGMYTFVQPLRKQKEYLVELVGRAAGMSKSESISHFKRVRSGSGSPNKKKIMDAKNQNNNESTINDEKRLSGGNAGVTKTIIKLDVTIKRIGWSCIASQVFGSLFTLFFFVKIFFVLFLFCRVVCVWFFVSQNAFF